MPHKLLLIDDDTRLHELLSEYMTGHDIQLTAAPDGHKGLAQLEDQTFDVILLDVMMPGIDGFEVLRRVRQKHEIPVIMLTARGDDTDRIVGLEMGADDYLPKPFNPRELLARIRAVLRRTSTSSDSERLEQHGIVLDIGARTVTRDSDEIELTAAEFDLLAALMRRPGRVVTRSGLLDAAGRGDVFVSVRTVDVHISHLRQKLEEDPRTPRLIKTVRGVGYVFAKEEQQA